MLWMCESAGKGAIDNRHAIRQVRYLALSGAIVAFWGISVRAQIVPDATLGAESSRVTTNGQTDQIDGGAIRGANLFHSFREFNIGEGGTAYFNNAAQIENILARITGSNPSNIFGILKAGGSANVFLLNPNGIIFGPNAQLQVGGSFVASTANSFKFPDGSEFSATNPQAPPLLTVNVPVGLQFGPNPGSIVVQGQYREFGLGVATGSFMPEVGGLRVQSGKTLALVGGNVSVDGGILQAPGGRVELGGLAGEGIIGLNSDRSLSFPEGVARSDVAIGNKAGINVIGSGGGDIAITARNLNISGESLLTAGIASFLGTAETRSGNITLNATDSINIDASRLENNLNPGAIGKSGDINIDTGSLSLTNGAQLSTSTFGTGNAGTVFIDARSQVSLEGDRTAIFSNVESGGQGDAGGIFINTGSLFLKNGAQLQTLVRRPSDDGRLPAGQGNGGIVSVQATDQVSLEGTYTAANSSVEYRGRGNAGGIYINTGSLFLRDGAYLNSSTYGIGNAGTISINAKNAVTLEGNGPSLLDNTTIYNNVESGGVGDAGGIYIYTGSLFLKNGAQLQTLVRRPSDDGRLPAGQGNAGRIFVQATDQVSLEGTYTAANSSVGYRGRGNAGGIYINTGSFFLRDGAYLNSSTYGIGNAGTISINAKNAVTLEGNGPFLLDNTTIYNNVESGGVGDAGEIFINTGTLFLKNGAQLQALVRGSSNDGRLPAGQGNAGRIFVQAIDKVSIEGTYSGIGSSLEAEAKGNAGYVSIEANDISLERGSYISSDVAIGAIGAGGGIFIDASTLSLTGGSALQALTFGTGSAGVIQVYANDISLESGSYIASNLVIVGINASSQEEINGAEEIYKALDDRSGAVELPEKAQDFCTQGEDSEFIITGRGGLPPNPGDTLSSDALVVNTIAEPTNTTAEPTEETEATTTAPIVSSPVPDRIVEAQGFSIDAKGRVVLIAEAPRAAPHAPGLTPPACRISPAARN